VHISAYTPCGRRIVHLIGLSCFDAWPCLRAALAAQFECARDEVRLVEDDDGVERLRVRGTVIGYVITETGGMVFGRPEPAAAAE
jgi:hypothetical protein